MSGAMRPCIGCDAELDITAHLAGISDQGERFWTSFC